MEWEELGVQEAAVPSPSTALQASIHLPATTGRGAAAKLTPGLAPGCLESLEEELLSSSCSWETVGKR